MKQTSTSSTQAIDLAFSFALPSTIQLASMATAADFTTALNEGLSASFTSSQGESVGTVKQESAFMPMDMAIKAGAGQGTGVFNKDTFSVNSTGAGLELDVTGSGMPAPVKVTIGPIAIGMTSPVIANETAGDYGFVMKLSQLTINEEAWAMFDPQGALPRDAADLAIDISGKTKIDIPGMIAADEAGMPPPVPAPDSLNITELGLKVAGAALAGTGAFTFDNSMGIPMPLGEANISITGANALIDGLIATGLMAEEDAMGARMMMGMFMVPGANPEWARG